MKKERLNQSCDIEWCKYSVDGECSKIQLEISKNATKGLLVFPDYDKMAEMFDDGNIQYDNNLANADWIWLAESYSHRRYRGTAKNIKAGALALQQACVDNEFGKIKGVNI